MILNDTVQIALRNLRQAKLRTALTVMGVSIGIASLAGMVSLGVGLQDQVVNLLTQSGVFDAITVSQARPGGRGGFPGGGAFGGRGGRLGGPGGGRRGAGGTPATAGPPLDDEAVKKIAALAQVKTAYPAISVPVEVTAGPFSETLNATGVPLSSRDEGVFQTMAAGSFFGADTDNAVLLSLDAAKRIRPEDPKSLVGTTLTLSYAAAPPPTDPPALPDPGSPVQIRRVVADYTVVGIVERGPSAGIGAAGIMIPLGRAKAIDAENVTSVQALLREGARSRAYTSVTVKVTHAQFTQDVEDQIKAMGFTVFSLNDALQGAKRAFIVLDIILLLIGSIALTVSSLGIVNTMVMSILERTREIGIMKAIGGSDGDIRSIFLVEASAIGILGGVAGIILGWLVGRAINLGANLYIQSQGGTPANLFSLPWWLVGGALVFSIVVSVVAGSFPAARAAKLDPIQALRHD
jgi:putative ABC transport system permease protein